MPKDKIGGYQKRNGPSRGVRTAAVPSSQRTARPSLFGVKHTRPPPVERVATRRARRKRERQNRKRS